MRFSRMSHRSHHSISFPTVTFYDNVIVDGGSDSEDSIDFDIYGHVEVRFDQEEALVIDTETLMRDDVRIAASCDDSWDHCESSDA